MEPTMRTTLQVLSIAAATAALLSPRTVSAYCYDSTPTWVRDSDPLEAIPVYIDLGGPGDLRRTGLDEDTLKQYVMTILEEVNRSAGRSPRLYFGGIRTPDTLINLSDLPAGSGIHIRAARCLDDSGGDADNPGAVGVTNPGGAGSNRALIRLKSLLADDGEVCSDFEPWNTTGAQQIGPDVPVCVEPYPGVFSEKKGYCIPYKDFKGVLMHELLHSLGLQHHELDVCQCQELGGVHGPVLLPTYGSVRTWLGVGGGYNRSLFLDDMSGLDALASSYGSAPRTFQVIEYGSNDGTEWSPIGAVPLGADGRTVAPVAASSATDDDDERLYLAYVEENGFVRVTSRTASGWTDLGRVSTTTFPRGDGVLVHSGKTTHPPAIAYAPPNGTHSGKIAVAWIFEDETAAKAYVYWAVRNVAGGAWMVSSPADPTRLPFRTNFRRVGLGYDPTADVFVMTYLDGVGDDPRAKAAIRTIATTGVISTAEILETHDATPGDDWHGNGQILETLHEIGSPVCSRFGANTRCVIPVSTSGPEGPCLAYYYGTRNTGGSGFAVLERQVNCYDSSGIESLAVHPSAAGKYVGTIVSWAGGADPVAEDPPQSFDCEDDDLCATGAVRGVRLRYTMGASVGDIEGFVLPGAALDFGVSAPSNMCFIPGTSYDRPGPPDPGTWFPASAGTVGEGSYPYRIYVPEPDQHCGNGIREGGEDCDGDDVDETCGSLDLGEGTVECSDTCMLEPHCHPPEPVCESGAPGEPGCECIPVDESIFCGIGDEECTPDGPGSYDEAWVADNIEDMTGLYCVGDSVCGLHRIDGDLVPTCEDCSGTDNRPYCAAFGQAGPSTFDFDGPMVPLACWGGSDDGWNGGLGRCLPAVPESGSEAGTAGHTLEEFERTRWLCKADCQAMEDTTIVDYACAFGHLSNGYTLRYAACVEVGGCGGLVDGICEADGNRCDPSSSSCIEQCNPAHNTGAGNVDCAPWGYPPGYMCTTSVLVPRCVPSACMNYPSVTDLTYCQQFMNGEP
jgi:hypothetical protein